MPAILDLLKSERGILTILLVIASVVLSAIGVITPQQWLDYTKWIFVTYVAGKTITGAVAAQGQGAPNLATVAAVTDAIDDAHRNASASTVATAAKSVVDYLASMQAQASSAAAPTTTTTVNVTTPPAA